MSIPGSEAVEVPVLIVGAGPAGLALSVALSRYGVGHLVVERHRSTAHTPRAHITNHDIHAWARAYLTALDHTGRLARHLPRQRRSLARR